jgi:hypothetical protein
MPTRIDLQRYKKTYPFIRREPRLYYLSLTEGALSANIKTAEVSFAGGNQIVHTFPGGSFTSAPHVTVTPLGASANFNVFVVSVAASSPYAITIEASVPNSDSVHIHAIEVL